MNRFKSADTVYAVVALLFIWNGVSSVISANHASSVDHGSLTYGLVVIIFASMVLGVSINKMSDSFRKTTKKPAKAGKK